MAQHPASLTDIKVLLEFLKQGDGSTQRNEAQITSLQALSSMCRKDVAEMISQCGGLKQIWKLCGLTTSPEVCQACLYTLACAAETSVRVKSTLSTKGVFQSLRGILASTNIPEKTRLFTVYFLIPLVCESETGQELVRTSGCLQLLLKLFVSGVQLFTCGQLAAENRKKEIWTLSAKTLRRATALPRNKTNQLACSKYIPHMVTILHESKGDDKIVLHSCQVLGAVMENNSLCQEKAFASRAMEVLILVLQVRSASAGDREVLGEIVVALHSLVEDKEEYCERFRKLGGMTVFVGLLDTADNSKLTISVHHVNHVLTILSRCAGYSERGRQTLIKSDLASIVVRLMNSIQGNDYFNKISPVVLSQCMQTNQEIGKSPVKDNASEDGRISSDESSSENDKKSKVTQEGMEEDFEMINGGGSCITDVLERQQTQIDLLQKLLIQERERRIDNERTLAEISKRTPMSACGSSILSPEVSECGSCRTPFSRIRHCPRRTWSNVNTPEKATGSRRYSDSPFAQFSIPSSRSRPTSYNSLFPGVNAGTYSQSNILTSTALPSPETHSSQKCVFLSPDGNPLPKMYQANVEQRKTKDHGCQTDNTSSSNHNIIDVESFTPKNTSKSFLRATDSGKGTVISQSMMKYYVTESNKIRQYVAPTLTSNTDGKSRSNLSRGENVSSWTSRATKYDNDDVMSACSEIIFDEIQRERKRKNLRPRWSSPSSTTSIARRTRSGKCKRIKEERDVYSFKDPSPASMRFKKPTILPPRFLQALKTPRIKFDAEEEKNLARGVKTLGKNFKEILYTYNFHPSRTAMHLRDKYRNMSKK